MTGSPELSSALLKTIVESYSSQAVALKDMALCDMVQ